MLQTQARTGPSLRQPTNMKWVRSVALYTTLLVIALVIVIPLIWAVLTSFKTDFDVISSPAGPLPHPFTFESYRTLFGSSEPVLRWFANSMLAAVLHTTVVLITASCGAYALARLEFPGKRLVFGAIIATLLVPPITLLIPNYLIVQYLGWLDTTWAVSIPSAAGAFGIFFLRQFFISLPKEVEEAARIDGAGEFRIFAEIVLPLARPALATLAVLSFLSNWNDFLWPVYVLLSPDHFTLQPGLAILQGAYGGHYGVVMGLIAIEGVVLV